MNTQNIRFVLMAILVVLGMLLYNHWQQDNSKSAVVSTATVSDKTTTDAHKDIPSLFSEEVPSVISEHKTTTTAQTIEVDTDVLRLKIDPVGGDIVWLLLKQYAESQEDFGQGYVLLDNNNTRYYIAQSGLASEQGPDTRGVGRAHLQTTAKYYELKEQQNTLSVDFKTTTSEGVGVTKRFIFTRGSYLIQVEYLIDNQSSAPYQASFYARLKRKEAPESGGHFMGAQTFTGAAIHTEKTPFKKIKFSDLDEKPIEQSVQGGWAAMVEHYFVSAWIPDATLKSLYQASKGQNGLYSVGLIEPSFQVQPGEKNTISTQLYVGPEVLSTLENLAPGLELSVDYGILWPICRPIFWLLQQMFDFTQNWGVAIILTTILIKLLFYKLSASSYRSMGRMRNLQPRINSLKERCGEDKQKFSQEMMGLYKKEKINPLGGCLPIVIQIPVFIALYYVLLGSVELREAPFFGWIQDLSAKDPFYVLPILMGASMFFQQRLNPTPPDPIQAKVMMFMPIVFTVLFLNFPSGLVLYWFVNNLLSMAQQWYITRKIEMSSLKSHGAK